MKKYNILNLYIRGSNVSPQTSHITSRLWRKKMKGEFSTKAEKLFDQWSENSEVEIDLQGGYHVALEELYEHLKNIPELPSAKFNESQEALAGACTVVSFIANERIVALNNYIRFNRIKPKQYDSLKTLSFKDLFIDFENPDECAHINDDEIFVASYISKLPTTS